ALEGEAAGSTGFLSSSLSSSGFFSSGFFSSGFFSSKGFASSGFLSSMGVSETFLLVRNRSRPFALPELSAAVSLPSGESAERKPLPEPEPELALDALALDALALEPLEPLAD